MTQNLQTVWHGTSSPDGLTWHTMKIGLTWHNITIRSGMVHHHQTVWHGTSWPNGLKWDTDTRRYEIRNHQERVWHGGTPSPKCLTWDTIANRFDMEHHHQTVWHRTPSPKSLTRDTIPKCNADSTVALSSGSPCSAWGTKAVEWMSEWVAITVAGLLVLSNFRPTILPWYN